MFPEFLDTKGSLDENSFAGYGIVLAGKWPFGFGQDDRIKNRELRTNH